MIETKLEKDGGHGGPPHPEWEAALRRELARRDPRLVEVYDVYAGQFHRDCTAAQVHRALKDKLGAFAPSEDTVRRLLLQCRALESDYRA
jgi:hypothetical protein